MVDFDMDDDQPTHEEWLPQSNLPPQPNLPQPNLGPLGDLFHGDDLVDSATRSAIQQHLTEIAEIRSDVVNWAKGNGNVLAVVNMPIGVNARACDGQPWTDFRLRMDYQKLIGLGSSEINRMLAPPSQRRFRRRMGFDQQLPPGIDYVVDFTPPSEGPELADLTAALWLPKAVKFWYLAGHYLPEECLKDGKWGHRVLSDKAVGATLALGHDDACRYSFCLVDTQNWRVQKDVTGIFDGPPNPSRVLPPFRMVEDYCPVRHRMAIVRILRYINGNSDGLLLNSAVRMWTIAQVAISLDVTSQVVGFVTQWLIAPPNTKFIEICPEKAFQLARALQIPSVLQVAFHIMVNEQAVDKQAVPPSPRLPPLTWVGRKRDDYGDFPSDPIEYAARAMVDRITRKYVLLHTDSVFEHLPLQITHWALLRELDALVDTRPENKRLQDVHTALKKGLVAAFRSAVNRIIDMGPPIHLNNLLRAQRSHYIPDHQRKPVKELYLALNHQQRALTPFFWDQLRRGLEGYESFTSFKHAGDTLEYIAQEHWDAVQKAFYDGDAVAAMQSDDFAARLVAEERSPLNKSLRFDLTAFCKDVHTSVRLYCMGIQNSNHELLYEIPLFLSDHLLLDLSKDELKYLPIWADGLDDETGGVFQDVIPETDMGPSEPGPAYHTGYTVATATDTATEMDDRSTVAPSDLGIGQLGIYSDNGTVAGSIDAQQSTATSILPRGRVVAAPSEMASERFSTVDDGEFAEAAYAEPAAHQAQGQALAEYADTSKTVSEWNFDDGESVVTSMASVVAARPAANDGHAGSSSAGADTGGATTHEDDDIEMGEFWDDDDTDSTLSGFEDVADMI